MSFAIAERRLLDLLVWDDQRLVQFETQDSIAPGTFVRIERDV
jgi:hypothetical protein